MEINEQLVDRLANLSKLAFNEAEKEIILSDLKQMIGFVDKLNELDTSGVTPLMHMTDAINQWRTDEVKGSINTSDGLKPAPDANNTYFRVPKVISKK
ncbi:Asp-tRNA(Asn)/Glu-tRNA(Gln) amidotransferase subunit GatC [Gynurincola endophyticus]|jgi:aspartyl-tRNA(Asn)/glutamyl-tRNA(Gln) amidotransferase subunit C|uniref:Asp-tRNA(Asn)/Glu-tRNA(Gln) amidotransferase subunit GatC n=1 Tax=Gynurincola endophyticus TaxID=2479004 RepID=UPI000F8CCAAF|nr:Asp-tRNA(Asn)/Glu-tRNA(Gln) amidotransferase subunit GatC [Gynurincola endophyticus]